MWTVSLNLMHTRKLEICVHCVLSHIYIICICDKTRWTQVSNFLFIETKLYLAFPRHSNDSVQTMCRKEQLTKIMFQVIFTYTVRKLCYEHTHTHIHPVSFSSEGLRDRHKESKQERKWLEMNLCYMLWGKLVGMLKNTPVQKAYFWTMWLARTVNAANDKVT